MVSNVQRSPRWTSKFAQTFEGSVDTTAGLPMVLQLASYDQDSRAITLRQTQVCSGIFWPHVLFLAVSHRSVV